MKRDPEPRSVRRIAVLTVALVGLAAASGVTRAELPFEVRQLAEGVHLLFPREAGLERTNSLVVEQSGGLLVVEAQPTVAAARDLLRTIGEMSDRPVRFLVLSHAHVESTGGASAFPASTVVVARSQARDAMIDPTFRAAAELLVGRERPESWVAPPLRMPELVIRARTEVDDPERLVELFAPAHSHTEGDLLVWLPKQRILYAGALLGEGGSVYARDGNIEGWLGTLNHLATMNPAIVIPIRGPAADVRALRRQRDAFAWLRGQVELAFVEDVAPGRIADRILRADGIDEYFDRSVDPSFLRGTIEKILEEAEANRRKRGIP